MLAARGIAGRVNVRLSVASSSQCLLFAAAAEWTKSLLLARGLASTTKPDDLRTIFPGAEEIVVTQDASIPAKMLKRAAKKQNDG